MRYRAQFIAVLTAAFMLASGAGMVPAQSKTPAAKKIGPKGVLHKGMKTIEAKVTPSAAEQKKKEVAERLDKAGLLYTGKVVVDENAKMLEPMEHIKKFVGSDIVIAKTPPKVEFAVVPVDPMLDRKSVV